jgi:secreted PhoX family phosphatase
VPVNRRQFLTTSAAVAVALGAPNVPAGAAGPFGSRPRFGPLGDPDPNGLRLPPGFRSRVVARAGQPVAATDHVWHIFPDGGACFPTRAGGWVYVSNSETFGPADGGVGAIEFDHRGAIVAARPILTGSTRNCAGGRTPWGTWLSCEETEGGRVFECDPDGRGNGVDRPALGRFIHEAAAVDGDLRHVYLTEDAADGRLYRTRLAHRRDLRAGTLEVARVEDGRVDWLPVPDPLATGTPTRYQVLESTPFAGGEGIWWVDGGLTFVTKRDHRVWRLDTRTRRIGVLYDGFASTEGVLGEPDNVTVTDRGEVYVSEDQEADQEIVLIDRRGRRAQAVLRLTDQTGSELTGLAFNPRGDRMYVSSQRGADRAVGPGITYEIQGPFFAFQRPGFGGLGLGRFGLTHPRSRHRRR